MPNKFEKYTLDKFQPECVQYWDRQFAKLKLWFNWLICKTVVESNLEEVQELFECDKKEAYRLIWGVFISCATGDEDDTPLEDAYVSLVRSVSPEEFPLFMAHICIGASIHDGFDEKESIEIYKEWLLDDPKNRVYGKYQITDDLRSEPVRKTFKKKPHN